MKTREEYLRDAVERLLSGKGFQPILQEPVANDFCADMRMVSGNSMFFISCRCLPIYRAMTFRPLVGDAILRFQHSEVSSGQSSSLLLAIMLGRMSKHAIDDLREYADRYARDLNWLVIAENGRGLLCFENREIPVELAPYRERSHSSGVSGPGNLFSPKNQHLLKLLLMPGVPEKFWGGSRRRPLNISELAALSGVSQAAVSQFVQRAESGGFLRRSPDGLRMVNHRELLEDWSYAVKHRPPKSVTVRHLHGREPEDRFLSRIREYCKSGQHQPLVCIGSHLGCHLLGLGRSNNREMVLHVNGPVESIMDDLDLIPASREQAQLRLVVPAFRPAVFNGCVQIEGLPVADALQCYLDVRTSPARGREQAETIFDRVLMKHFESAG